MRLELIRMAWDYAHREADIHKNRYLQLFAVFLTIGLTAVGSVLLNRVDPFPWLASRPSCSLRPPMPICVCCAFPSS